MSPTEDDLRRSLAADSDDAKDVVNASRVIALADEQRSRRRTRLLSAAAAVIVVGGVATGIGFLTQHGGNDDTASSNAGSAGGNGAPTSVSGNVAGGAGNPASVPQGRAGVSGGSTASCPATPPSRLLPGGGGSGQFGSTGKLFTQPVATVTVCAYPTQGGSTKPARIELTGAQATTFTASLENASKLAPRGIACSDLRQADQQTLAVLATSTSGKKLPTVITTINEPACAVMVSNGTAIRYGWTWPQSLQSRLVDLLPGNRESSNVPTLSPPTGQMSGSPLH